MLVAITNMETWETKHVEGGSKGSLCKLYVFFLRLLRVDQKKTEKTKINHSELRWTWTSTGSVLCTKEPFSMDLQLGMLWNGLLDIETSEQKTKPEPENVPRSEKKRSSPPKVSGGV